jgi:hypothetical protein
MNIEDEKKKKKIFFDVKARTTVHAPITKKSNGNYLGKTLLSFILTVRFVKSGCAKVIKRVNI